MAKRLDFPPTPEPEDDDAIVARLNASYAVVLEGGDVMVLVSSLDPETQRTERARVSVGAFRTLLRHRRISRGRKTISEADIWLDHPARRTYARVVFDPDPCYVARPETLNLWTGFPIRPRAGAWDAIRTHLFEIGACGDDDLFRYLLQWLAFLFYAPHKSPESAIVWQGAQGAGKGSLVRILARLTGQHFLHVTHTRHFAGNFNAHLQDALVVFADEALWAGDKSAEGPLKQLVTETHMVLERKGCDPIMARNYVHLVMATNSEWAVPMGLDDRRFCVIEVPDRRVGDRDYFARLYAEIEGEGVAALAWSLQEHFFGLDHPPRIPSTAIAEGAALKQKVLTMSPAQRWWFGVLQRGGLTGAGAWLLEAPKEEVHAAYLKEMDQSGHRQRRAVETELGIFLRSVVPGLRDARRGYGAGNRMWLFPTLAACRQEFARVMRHGALFADQVALEAESDLL